MAYSLELSEIARNWGLLIAATLGIAIAIWRAIAADRQSKAQMNQVEQGRREHVATLFSEAVKSLDDQKLHVRLGSILMLREIVSAFPELSRPAVDLLSSYLSSVEYGDDDPPTDVQAIIDIVVPRAEI